MKIVMEQEGHYAIDCCLSDRPLVRRKIYWPIDPLHPFAIIILSATVIHYRLASVEIINFVSLIS